MVSVGMEAAAGTISGKYNGQGCLSNRTPARPSLLLAWEALAKLTMRCYNTGMKWMIHGR